MDKAEAAAPAKPKDPPVGVKDPYSTVIPTEQPQVASAGERALLERLQKRREELDARARELDLRESMLKAAEKKLETEPAPGKPSAAKSGDGGGQSQGRDDTENARFKSVVTIYETMKPKDAAKIFDRLDIKVLLDMASQIKPQRMSEIMAQMTPEAAERLTIELAAKSGAERTLNPMNLPKIDGRPGGG
jgi:flagellar motility protein MotE (MotC chaperone)